MTGLLRKAALLAAAGVFITSAAMAGVPSPGNSTVPACISLVGNAAGIPDAAGTFSVTVRDLANNPLNGASVVIDLSGCTDLSICDDQLDAGALVNCAAKTTRKFTDALGAVSFTVLGGSNGGGNATTLLGGGKIYANGVLIGSPTASAYDLDGASGVGANDLSAWLGDFGSGNAFGRSDYDCSGGIGANDLSLWLGDFGSSASTTSCAVACP
ncbi:MAG: hypothetical protein K8R56_10115 [Candidatus Eisenbacteria bacterium]|nr:hypothetical protein [Candidatus Eisenbacteria bacterium]